MTGTARPSTVRQKIMGLGDLARKLGTLRQNGKRIVLCHGVFDLVHIGHIRYFEEARQFGDILVVTVTPDRYVNKGPHRPAFAEQLRAEALAALVGVDFVAINEWPTAVETIGLLRPDVYAKGPDYGDASTDRTGGIKLEEDAVKQVGGRLAITAGITFSSSNIINAHLSDFPKETQDYLAELRERHTIDEVVGYLDSARNLKVLVVGETIIDEYQFCVAIGKSSKEPTLAVRLETTERYAGGALAISNHVANFAGPVGILTVSGGEPEYEDFIALNLNPALKRHVVRRPGVPTIVKRRIIERYFFHKLLEIYEIADRTATADEDNEVCALLSRLAPDYDVVLVSDFGHGLMTSKAVATVQKGAKFLAINVQSNAGNMGFNTISKYTRADYASVTETELRLDAKDNSSDLPHLMARISKHLGTSNVAATMGRSGCSIYEKNGRLTVAPALATRVVDRIGAGDAFLSVTALCAAQGAPADVIAFIGNVVGAEAVRTVGNSRPLDKLSVIRHIESLMK